MSGGGKTFGAHRWVQAVEGPLVTDMRVAARSLARARSFSCAAILTLAVGVAVNLAVFSVVDRLLFRPLPYAEPGRLVQLHQLVIPGIGDAPMTPGMFGEVSEAIAQRTRSFSGVAWAEGFAVPTVVQAGEPPLKLTVATANLLEVLGVRPLLGRSFVPSDAEAQTRGVILTYEAWQQRFGGSKDILSEGWGSSPAYEVIGVLEPGFLLPSARFMERCDGLFAGTGAIVNTMPGAMAVGAVARLRPGVSAALASSEIAGLMDSVGDWGSAGLRGALKTRQDTRVVVQPLRSGLSMVVGPYLWLLLGGVWLLLAVACVNLSTLLLARGRSRESDIAVCIALGAASDRLIRQATLEATFLCVAGSAIGLLVCAGSAPLVLAILPPEFRGITMEVLDGRALGATVTITVMAAAVAAIGPALGAARLNVARTLQAAGRGRPTAGIRASFGLLAVQAALGAALVAGAGVAIPGFLSLAFRSPGYSPRDLFSVAIPHGSSEDSARKNAAREVATRPERVRTVLETVRAVPQVVRAAAQLTPFGYSGNPDLWRVEGARTATVAVSDGWIETLGAVVRAGRAISSDEIRQAAQIGVTE